MQIMADLDKILGAQKLYKKRKFTSKSEGCPGASLQSVATARTRKFAADLSALLKLGLARAYCMRTGSI